MRRIARFAFVAALAVGCDSQAQPAESTTIAERSTLSFNQIRAEFDCVEINGEQALIAPLRGQAALRGMSCRLDGSRVHVFERAPENDVPAGDEGAFHAGGSLARIDFVTGGGTSTPGCDVELTVTDGFFVVAPAAIDIGSLDQAIGESVRQPIAASPTVSYLDASCDIN